MLMGLLTWAIGPVSKENGVEWLKILAFAITLALLIRWPLIEPYKIPSGSMEPTLHGDARLFRGDRVFVNKWVYGVRYPFTNKRIWRGQDPQRWDIVVFKTPEPNARYSTLVKRIVGMPGERIHIQGGKIYADGVPLELPESMPNIEYTSTGDPKMRFGIWQEDAYAVVPPDHYLVLGDNSAHSRDGRFFGWLPNQNILGRVACIWWPPPRWTDFTGFTSTWWWRVLLAVLAVFAALRLFLGRSWHVRRGTHETTFRRGDRLLVNRAVYGMPVPFTRTRISRGRDPKRGELVLYEAPSGSADGHELLLGRIAALPGEQVYIDGGKLTIDGNALEEPRVLAERTFTANGKALFARSKSRENCLVPDHHFFIVSEDEDGMPDSRVLGWIPRAQLVGPVTAVWWPPHRWRRVAS